jgi:sensor histidine kinase regulating citrate/malate metabolism
MGVAVTIIDTEGMLLYYNKHAAKILDRKPEYIGEDIRSHHKKAISSKKFDLMFKISKKEKRSPSTIKLTPMGKPFLLHFHLF